MNQSSNLLCEVGELKPGFLEGKAVVVMRGVCGFSQKAQVAQYLGAAVLLIASKDDMVGLRKICCMILIQLQFCVETDHRRKALVSAHALSQ